MTEGRDSLSAGPQWGGLGGLLDDLFDAPAADPDCGSRYELGEVIGQGGQGQVIKARDTVLDTEVAIKRVAQAGRGDRWIKHEMDMLAQLSHPGIPRLLDAGQASDGCWFIVMPFIKGRPLTQVAHEIDAAESLRLFVEIAEAVAHAHAQGLIHRDLKPENILISDAADGARHAMVVDWALLTQANRAKFVAHLILLHQSNSMVKWLTNVPTSIVWVCSCILC